MCGWVRRALGILFAWVFRFCLPFTERLQQKMIQSGMGNEASYDHGDTAKLLTA